MKRRTRSLLLPAAVVAVLAVLAVLQVCRERAAALDPLTRLDTSQVQAITVRCQGCPTRRYEKSGGVWRMQEPRAAAADPEVVGKLLSIAAMPVRHRHPRADLDPAKLGLDPPQATLALDDLVLAFGTSDAIHGDRYVTVGDGIALVPDRFSAWIFAIEPTENERP
ncbi:MAG: DUF4340 domain-containing protein [Xanthomonadales bacterium]|nr:DUF4340 domain-containing protein [Xanthomonadales bacterium]